MGVDAPHYKVLGRFVLNFAFAPPKPPEDAIMAVGQFTPRNEFTDKGRGEAKLKAMGAQFD